MINKSRASDIFKKEDDKCRTTKGEAISIKSTWRTKVMLPIATPNALFSCYITFRKSLILCTSDFSVQTTIADSETLEKQLANFERDPTLCF